MCVWVVSQWTPATPSLNVNMDGLTNSHCTDQTALCVCLCVCMYTSVADFCCLNYYDKYLIYQPIVKPSWMNTFNLKPADLKPSFCLSRNLQQQAFILKYLQKELHNRALSQFNMNDMLLSLKIIIFKPIIQILCWSRAGHNVVSDCSITAEGSRMLAVFSHTAEGERFFLNGILLDTVLATLLLPAVWLLSKPKQH